MRRRLPIRWRFAATSLLLTLIVLIIVGAVVLVLEKRSIDADLRSQASLEARSLLAVAARATSPAAETIGTTSTATSGGTTAAPTAPSDTDDTGATVPSIDELETRSTSTKNVTTDGEQERRSRTARRASVTLDPSTEAYLVRRSASETLLAVRAPHGTALINQETARALVPLLSDATGTTTITVDGDAYTAAIERDTAGITAVSAVPQGAASNRISALLRALLAAGGVGILLTAILAWLAARSALRPLSVMTRRAELVTAGRPEARVGPIGGTDEIARLTGAIDEMLERLQSAFAAQQRFVQDASHELRTPITIARGHLEVLDPQREEPAAVQAEIDLAVGELARMGRLVERLLLLARAGEIPVERMRPIDVGDLAAEAVERVRGDAVRSWHVDRPAVSAVVHGDHDALVDVLVNLLTNAIRHTGNDGRIDVEVGASRDAVHIAVIDDGDGVPPELLPHLFDRFTRADAARSRDAGGAGLGLAICRAYVEAHGGTISARATSGHGATFDITLPRAV